MRNHDVDWSIYSSSFISSQWSKREYMRWDECHHTLLKQLELSLLLPQLSIIYEPTATTITYGLDKKGGWWEECVDCRSWWWWWYLLCVVPSDHRGGRHLHLRSEGLWSNLLLWTARSLIQDWRSAVQTTHRVPPHVQWRTPPCLQHSKDPRTGTAPVFAAARSCNRWPMDTVLQMIDWLR